MAARTPVFVKEDLERFISIFPTAGSDSVVWISDYFCEFALVNPKTFFSVMGEHSALFDSWLKTIDETSFTDMGGCLDRECFRERMVTLLETIQWAGGLEDAKSRAMLKRLLDRVKEVKVRHSPV